MAAKAISRRVKIICSSRQYSLFDEAIAGNVDGIIAKLASVTSPVRFEVPDPRNLSINGKPLEEHLQLAGLTAPLKLRPLLLSLSLAEFEASYRSGGRPPYAPQAMMGIILYGILQGLSSLRDLEWLAHTDVGCW